MENERRVPSTRTKRPRPHRLAVYDALDFYLTVIRVKYSDGKPTLSRIATVKGNFGKIFKILIV